MQGDLETVYTDIAGAADGVDKQTAYEILCCAGHNPSSLDIANFWKELGKEGNFQSAVVEVPETLCSSLTYIYIYVCMYLYIY